MSEQPEASTGALQVNGPTLVSLLYLATYITVVSAPMGVVLAYVWRRQPLPEWQHTQFTYLIRTFWMGLGGYALIAAVGLAAIALFETDYGTMPDAVQAFGLVVCGGGLLGLTVLLLVRCAMVIVNAQQRVPMRNARSWWV